MADAQGNDDGEDSTHSAVAGCVLRPVIIDWWSERKPLVGRGEADDEEPEDDFDEEVEE